MLEVGDSLDGLGVIFTDLGRDSLVFKVISAAALGMEWPLRAILAHELSCVCNFVFAVKEGIC